MGDKREYLKRGSDGILYQSPEIGSHYKDPGEAIKTWSKGELHLGCAESVSTHFSAFPCGKPPKYDPDHNGNFTRCGQHSAAAKKRIKDKRDARDAANRAKIKLKAAIYKINLERDEIIQAIADGHNDPRGLCADWLRRKAEATE